MPELQVRRGSVKSPTVALDELRVKSKDPKMQSDDGVVKWGRARVELE